MNQNNKYCHSEQTLSCHPELVSGSICGSAWRAENNLNGSCRRVNGFRTKSGMTDQSGRSMVEMLGVLAIIGVLSVGGISGYTTAMNKHKANEILNAAAVRAMAVSSQLQNGTPIGSVSLGEFDNENSVGGATFAAGVTDAGNNRFTIGFANNGKPSDAVIEQMQNIAGTDGIVRDLTGTGITYNNDLTADKIASDFSYDTCPSNFVKCGKTNSCVATAADCQCPTHATDNGDSCSCNAGYTGPKCDTCDTANGYEADGNGGCKKAGYTFKILGPGSWTHPKAYNECLDAGMKLATKAQLYEAVVAVGGSCDYNRDYDADVCTNLDKLNYEGSTKIPDMMGAVWLATCTEGDCPDSYYEGRDPDNKMIETGTISGFAWYVYGDGNVLSDGRSDIGGYALCVR